MKNPRKDILITTTLIIRQIKKKRRDKTSKSSSFRTVSCLIKLEFSCH